MPAHTNLHLHWPRAGVGLKHLTGEVKKMLGKITSIDQNNYPEMMGHTCIINAPAVFKVIWSIIKPMLDPRTQGKIEARSQRLGQPCAPSPAQPYAARKTLALLALHSPTPLAKPLRSWPCTAICSSQSLALLSWQNLAL